MCAGPSSFSDLIHDLPRPPLTSIKERMCTKLIIPSRPAMTRRVTLRCLNWRKSQDPPVPLHMSVCLHATVLSFARPLPYSVKRVAACCAH